MPLHDQVKVSGVTEACRYNDHTQCNNPSCGCDCHVKASTPAPLPSTSQVAEGLDSLFLMSCTSCGIKRPITENYCRLCGGKLSSLLCVLCGAGREPEDKFCWRCGADVNTKAPKSIPPPEVEKIEKLSEADERRVLDEIQRELKEAQANGTTEVASEVVETPGGPGTQFRIVSKPGQGGIVKRPSRPVTGAREAIKLPIKP